VLALLFSLGRESYGLPLGQVREVVRSPSLTTLPTAPAAVMGLLNLRGEVLPVLDTGLLAGSPFPAAAAYVVVVDAPDGPVGLGCGGQPRIAEIVPGPDGEAPAAGGVHLVAGEPVVLLDVRALVRLAPQEP
jgi:purine-binding chemotaxis protein CheW